MTLDAGYFRDVYAASPDPYGLAERWYEARKYAVSLALLPRERYGAVFEPGCSIGVLTARLAPRCASLLAWDAVPDAVASARARTAGLPGVRVERRVIPEEWPPDPLDLIVFSELLYYFDDADLDHVLRLGTGALRPGGQLLAVHWRHPAPDHPRTGDDVHGANLGFRASAYLRAGGFPDVPTAEDHALVAALTATGSRVCRTRALTVVTSARRDARAPHGFSDYLAELDAASA